MVIHTARLSTLPSTESGFEKSVNYIEGECEELGKADDELAVASGPLEPDVPAGTAASPRIRE